MGTGLTKTLPTTPIVHTEGTRVFATSKDVAAYFGKEHKHVLRDIEDLLLASAKAIAPNFGPIEIAAMVRRRTLGTITMRTALNDRGEEIPEAISFAGSQHS
ncbi:MAG: Rha family transcriptional regulator [Hyphomicrobiales bacterium]|nr:Rha family transcriptional regulator [Hyphomicrobiales bacterium]